MIDSFTGQYEFLSNFYWHKQKTAPWLGDIVVPTAEHAYQMAKTKYMPTVFFNRSQELHHLGNIPTPAAVKSAARRIKIDVADWDKHKIKEMRRVLWLKFSDPQLSQMLVATTPHILVEGNTWGDRFWGVDGTGENMLGCLLMELRGYHIYFTRADL